MSRIRTLILIFRSARLPCADDGHLLDGVYHNEHRNRSAIPRKADLKGVYMQIICVDRDEAILERTATICLEHPDIESVACFTEESEALEWLDENEAEIAILDISIPGINGLETTEYIRDIYPGMAIIFLTESPSYAVDAFALHASGYLLKPVSEERLMEEINYTCEKLPQKGSHIVVHTFGDFDVEVDGQVVSFARSRARELLAYLVDRQGRSISRATAFSAMWEDLDYDRPMQKQMDVVIRSLRDTLKKYDISEIFELQRGMMRVVPEKFDCDLYRFFEGDISAVNAFHGEYMSAYSWASLTESYMDRVSNNS